jgi:hypothetical protein
MRLKIKPIGSEDYRDYEFDENLTIKDIKE